MPVHLYYASVCFCVPVNGSFHRFILPLHSGLVILSPWPWPADPIPSPWPWALGFDTFRPWPWPWPWPSGICPWPWPWNFQALVLGLKSLLTSLIFDTAANCFRKKNQNTDVDNVKSRVRKSKFLQLENQKFTFQETNLHNTKMTKLQLEIQKFTFRK